MRAESLLNADDGVNQTGIRIQTNVRRHSESHWLPVLVRVIAGARAPVLFLAELGAGTKVASTAVPIFNLARRWGTIGRFQARASPQRSGDVSSPRYRVSPWRSTQ